MNKNFYIAHVMDIFALSEKEKVDVGIGFAMFRNEHRAKLSKELTPGGEVAIANEYEQFVTANYNTLCVQYNA